MYDWNVSGKFLTNHKSVTEVLWIQPCNLSTWMKYPLCFGFRRLETDSFFSKGRKTSWSSAEHQMAIFFYAHELIVDVILPEMTGFIIDYVFHRNGMRKPQNCFLLSIFLSFCFHFSTPKGRRWKTAQKNLHNLPRRLFCNLISFMHLMEVKKSEVKERKVRKAGSVSS